MPLKDLASLEISFKYKKRASDANHQFIENVIVKAELVEDYDTILFVFNMTFGTWLNLFRCKKDINWLKDQYKEVNNVNFDKIGENIACDFDNFIFCGEKEKGTCGFNTAGI